MLADFIHSELEALRSSRLVRDSRVIERVRGPFVTVEGRELLSFSSNDYLGIGQDPRLAEAAAVAAREFGWGAASSRALSGTTRWHAELEEAIADLKRTPAALLFPSGYMANLGLVTSLAGPGTLIVADRLNHASLIDACRLSRARIEVYPHRDAAAAGRLLGTGPGRKFILTDTVFSMDGDLAPLEELRKLGADLVVDDVHGLGVFGPDGRGCTDVPVQSGNLAKAAGSAGGFVAGSKDLIELLRSRARSFLFTTSPPPALCAAGLEALRILRSEGDRRRRLWENVQRLGAVSPIHTVVVGSNEAALRASRRLQELGFFVPAIRPPTVPEGTARLRVTLTAMHEPPHIEALKDALQKI
ncbi:MAG TPA: 8-amino-7-oxononanoate synthase [Planctomycetota bacterium]|nr:8-amino-7-oxononanoate synthase [Planctomycetota bacterium]